MSRTQLAIVIGLVGLAAYLAGAVALADRVVALHWTVQAAYFLVAGLAWVVPAYALMLWAVRK